MPPISAKAAVKHRRPKLKFSENEPQNLLLRLTRMRLKLGDNPVGVLGIEQVQQVMPLDLLKEILSYLHPQDLLHLFMTNQDFEAFLSSPDANGVWKSARSNVGFKSPPPGMTEIQWIALLASEPRCEIGTCDSQHRAKINFFKRIRVRNYLEIPSSSAFAQLRPPQSLSFDGYSYKLLEVLHSPGRKQRYPFRVVSNEDWYLLEDVKLLRYELQGMDEQQREEFLQAKKVEYQQRTKLANEYENWFNSRKVKA
ncbi:hypothetical protein AAF712_006936 [Marasmius tenuissimus]|uniref:F-box domain-containing protein n=1 Tax=Marasmius tenuissimus TaxID=585030 RepID=A0ABR2ZYE8_9AGAR